MTRLRVTLLDPSTLMHPYVGVVSMMTATWLGRHTATPDTWGHDHPPSGGGRPTGTTVPV